MIILDNPIELQKKMMALREKKTLGFVPTMGGLHEGHFSLIKRAIDENDHCLVSIFLNPTQFESSDDLLSYPSNLEEDIEALKSLGVNFLFMPKFESLYPDNYNYEISEKNLSHKLCGDSRPGHFNGVLTVVLKLLNLSQASKAYFGEKDFQQLKLIEGLCQAFFISTEIVAAPIVRDEMGLALSSRNQRLSPIGKEKAQKFAQLLKSQKNLLALKKELESENIEVDYLEEVENRHFAAVKIENVRLIDNVSK